MSQEAKLQVLKELEYLEGAIKYRIGRCESLPEACEVLMRLLRIRMKAIRGLPG